MSTSKKLTVDVEKMLRAAAKGLYTLSPEQQESTLYIIAANKIAELESELASAIECIEDSGIDWEEIKILDGR